eukprot:5456797-Prymnesium_polylepis.1
MIVGSVSLSAWPACARSMPSASSCAAPCGLAARSWVGKSAMNAAISSKLYASLGPSMRRPRMGVWRSMAVSSSTRQ